MNNFTIDMAEKSEKKNSNSILRLYKQKMMLKNMENKSNESKLTKKQICTQLRNSDGTIKRYRVDIDMDSPYKRTNYKKKTTKQNTNTNITLTQNPPKNENSKSTTNKKTKNIILKCGDPNIEQTFQNDKADSILENKQEDNKKYITISRRMVDQV